MCAASSTTSNDSASERPASSEVGTALIIDPFDNSNDVLLSISIWASFNHSGRFFIMLFTFLTRFAAVLNLVASTTMFFSLWKSINQTQ